MGGDVSVCGRECGVAALPVWGRRRDAEACKYGDLISGNYQFIYGNNGEPAQYRKWPIESAHRGRHGRMTEVGL